MALRLRTNQNRDDDDLLFVLLIHNYYLLFYFLFYYYYYLLFILVSILLLCVDMAARPPCKRCKSHPTTPIESFQTGKHERCR